MTEITPKTREEFKAEANKNVAEISDAGAAELDRLYEPSPLQLAVGSFPANDARTDAILERATAFDEFLTGYEGGADALSLAIASYTGIPHVTGDAIVARATEFLNFSS